MITISIPVEIVTLVKLFLIVNIVTGIFGFITSIYSLSINRRIRKQNTPK